MEMQIKSIKLENFKGIKNATYPFGILTKIIGANATGKTTIFDGFNWLLFNKDSQGNEKFSIRPLDKDGKQIDNVEINVTAVLDVDGKEIESSKTQKQNWVKKRGTSEKTLQGNVNLFEIDGYPKTESDYKKYINDLISGDLFKLITNPLYFPNLKWKEQREVLTKLYSVSNVELAKGNPEFALLVSELEKADTEDIRKKYQKALTEWKKKSSEIPVRIDELEKQKVDIDVAELELGRNDLRRRIAENKAKQEDVEKRYEEFNKISASVIELKTQQNELERVANLDLVKQKNNLEVKKLTLESELRTLEKQLTQKNRDISFDKSELSSKNAERDRLLKDKDTAKGREFDENSLVCPYCKQEYPADKKEQLRAEFETHKQEELEAIIKKGKAVRAVIDELKDKLPKISIEVADLEKKITVIKNDIVEVNKTIDSLPQSIDISDTEEYKEIQKQIDEANAIADKGFNADETRQKLKDEEKSLNDQLLEIEKQIAKAEYDVELDERISELQDEQREVSQKVADQEKMIFLLEKFIKFKMETISNSINERFEGVNFKLFDTQINGGIKECCECTVNGVPYGSLNNGHKIVAGLQIIKALQKHYGVSAPIFVDNAEALNDFNLPQMDCQMILLKVSEDKEMKVEVQ
ncbi:MAG: AAA family ATPase [Eubacterium sp.]